MTFLNKKNKAIIVLGMHRSGTSAISGVLSKMDVFMGSTLFQAQEGVNEKGFFENAGVVTINETLLDLQASSWDNPFGEKKFDLHSKEINTLKNKAIKFLQKEYSTKIFWGIKDPRVSILLPFWLTVFNQMNTTFYYLIMVRHPIEVSASLKKRDKFSQKKSLMIWLNYTLASLFHCKKKTCNIVIYHDLMSDPRSEVKKVVNFFDSSLIIKINESTKFISQKLRNHQTQIKKHTSSDILLILAETLYSELQQTKINWTHINKIKQQYNEYKSQLDSVLVEHLEQVSSRKSFYKAHFYNAYNSIWWKLAWPVKKIEQLLKRDKYYK